jgi:hypothetical protein
MVVALIALFVALGATTYAATGGNFILGQSNSAGNTTSLSAPLAGKKALQLTNTSTGAGATALGLNVAIGHTPFTVNSGTKVANLNADKLDSLDSTAFLPSSNLRTLFFQANAGTTQTLATVGPYTLKGQCELLGSSLTVRLIANTPNGGLANGSFREWHNDDYTNEVDVPRGIVLNANTDYTIAGGFDYVVPGNFLRIDGTIMLFAGNFNSPMVIRVDFDGVADARSNPGSCFLHGTATKGT